ncbi:hypothetical protein DASC09_035120 [Saccharomycopsis crataegensis]|uniref:GAF domain-containing protein n=1 Tax=Saccharomycopsis crataegensis TaxID=43959 RepID=A0AAV5QNT3_9ASCO|nr:hypothetical protein DASC09_035120 [Saccharomycopsis crataegensis]
MEAYSKGKWNLSVVPCPEFLTNRGLMIPPESYKESIRVKTVQQYMASKQWEYRSNDLEKIISRAAQMGSASGACISLIDETKQIVKCGHSSVRECPRQMSIDGHAILSSQYFIILDASTDWRFANNPLVKNYPKIRLYAGVPLVASNKQVIGILSIFDGFPRSEFNSFCIQELQIMAREIMSILDSTYQSETAGSQSQALKNIPSENRKDLINQVGRATGVKNSTFNTIPVYEKDGSGSSYVQNHNFRFGKHKFTEQDIFNAELGKMLAESGDFKLAANLLCKIILERLNLSAVYIMEIRVVGVFEIDPDYFPKRNEVEAEDFKFAEMLRKVEREHVITRVVDSYPDEISGELKGDESESSQSLHYKALSSEFGISVRSTIRNCNCGNGVCLPFYRRPSKLVRKEKIHINDQIFEPIELYLKSGGYIIGAFSENDGVTTHEDINYILNATDIYRKMYIDSVA